MSSAISSFRCVIRSPTRRRTSPRAGAGVRLQRSKPRRAEATARSTSSVPEGGKRPTTSVVSAGLTLSKSSPVDGSVQATAMKWRKVFMTRFGGAGTAGGTVRSVSLTGPGGGDGHPLRRDEDAGARQHLPRHEAEAPERDEEGERVGSAGAVAPGRPRRPEAAERRGRRDGEVDDQLGAAAPAVRPEARRRERGEAGGQQELAGH